MNDAPRYQTLRDYLRVIRAQRWLILLFVLAFGGAAYAYSAQQTDRYEAQASLSFKEATQDLELIGAQSIPRQTPEQRAAVNAQLITRVGVAQRVKEQLKLRAPVEDVQGAVSAQPEARTNLVVVKARSSDPRFAARLANEFARQGVAVASAEQKRRLDEAARSLRRSLSRARRRNRQISEFTVATFVDRIARVQALKDFGSPAEVVEAAEVPSSPVSPNPVRNSVLGVILGLTFGLVVAFVRDSLDVRLRRARDIQAQVKLPLVGHVGNDAMGSSGVISRNGHRALAPEDLEAFRILRKNLEFLDIDSPLKTIAITSALPEEGKSTVAASLAAACAQGGRNTLLVECDLRRPSLADRLGLKRSPGLTDYLAGHAGPQDVLQAVPVAGETAGGERAAAAVSTPEELVCITAGEPAPRPGDILGSERFRDFVAQVREAYDVVVLDTSPLLSVSDTLELLPHVDGVVLCIRAARTSRDEAKAAKAVLDHLPKRPTGLVVTGIKPGDEADYGYYSSTYAYGPARQT